MQKIELESIGKVGHRDGLFTVEIEKNFLPAMEALQGFGFLHVLWWGHLCNEPEQRAQLIFDKPYTRGPEKVGVFATRSPARPNPVLLSTIQVAKADFKNGILFTYYIDAEPGSPVLDLKPYHASDRVKNVQVPQWCGHWPQFYEDSGKFDWQNEFNF